MKKRSSPSPSAPKRPRAVRSQRPVEPGPGRQELRRISTRRELVLAGRRLFGSQGIYESRIEDITERAGIAKGTLYLHFDSKEDLLEAVTRDGLRELQDCVRSAVAGQKKLVEVLGEALRAHLDFFQENPDLMRILHQVRGALKFDQPAWRPLRTLLRLHVEFLADALAATEARAWTPARRRAMAALLFGIASGASSVRTALYPDSTDLAELGSAWAEPVARALVEVSARSARLATSRTRRLRKAR